MSTEVIYTELPPIQVFTHEDSGLVLEYAPEIKKLSPGSIDIQLASGKRVSLSELLRAARKHHDAWRANETSS